MNILELAILKKMVGGGGGSGTDNYNDLSNLPQINGETLAGNKTAENLGLQDALTFDSTPTEDSTNPVKSGGVYSALAGKQDNLTFDGVYNASTNKAATESTVTNAIAGLDVSAFSVDADETISSISETDGKVSVTKQDIAIASNQVVAMTGYTKPSSAPSNPAIQTGDTANQAFGKLEFKADTNQSNILYGLNRNAKNLIDFKFNDTPTTGQGYYWDTSCDLPAGTYSISFLLTSTQQVGMAVTVDGSETTKYLQTGTKVSHEYTFTATTGITRVRFWINSGTNTIYDFMISLKDVYDADPSYQLYGAPNYDLTQLEAEDRASLAEVVDSGAKNLVPMTWTNTDPFTDIHMTKNSDGSISVTATNTAATRIIELATNLNNYLTAGKNYVLSGCDGGDYNNHYGFALSTSNYTGRVFEANGSEEFTYASEVVNFTLVVRAGESWTKTFKPMVCTKAAFGVSPKFVPYRLPYDDVQSKTTLLMNNMGGLTFQGSDLNTLVAGGRYLVNNATDNPVSNAPYNSWQTVEVFQSDYSTYPKVYYQIATDVTGATVTSKWRRRVYNSGGQYNAWTAWSS